jgi:Skp family chaperone for outer membrane proteins
MFKISSSQLAIYAGLIVISAGATYGVMHWSFGKAPAGALSAESSLGGPVIPGVCVLSRQALFDESQIGKAANSQYQALRDRAQASVNAEQAKIVTAAKLLEAQKGALLPVDYQSRQQDLSKRLQALRAVAAQDSRELEATRQNATARISKEARPVIAQIYKERGCGLLVSREAIMGSNPAMDITTDVVAGLDAKITTIKVEREHIEAKPPIANQL